MTDKMKKEMKINDEKLTGVCGGEQVPSMGQEQCPYDPASLGPQAGVPRTPTNGSHNHHKELPKMVL